MGRSPPTGDKRGSHRTGALAGVAVCAFGVLGLTQIRGLRLVEAVAISLVAGAIVAIAWR